MSARNCLYVSFPWYLFFTLSRNWMAPCFSGCCSCATGCAPGRWGCGGVAGRAGALEGGGGFGVRAVCGTEAAAAALLGSVPEVSRSGSIFSQFSCFACRTERVRSNEEKRKRKKSVSQRRKKKGEKRRESNCTVKKRFVSQSNRNSCGGSSRHTSPDGVGKV